MAIYITPEELKVFNKIHMEEKTKVKETQNQTRVCTSCGKLIYNSELCFCKTDFKDQPTWYQNILDETREKGKASNGTIG